MAIKQSDILHYLWCSRAPVFQNCTSLSGNHVTVELFGEESDIVATGYHYGDVQFTCNGVRLRGGVRIADSLSAWQRFVSRNSSSAQEIAMVIVGVNDGVVKSDDFDTIILHLPISDTLYSHYIALSLSNGMECCNYISSLDSFSLVNLLDNLIVDRIDYKLSIVEDIFRRMGNDYGATLVWILFDTFMIATPNRPMMNELYRVMQYSKIINDIDKLEMVEALIFGSAGLLSDTIAADDYIYSLRKRFNHLKDYYKLLPMSAKSWKGGDFTASKSKWVLFAQLAALLFRPLNLVSSVGHSQNVKELDKLLQVEPSQYWTKYSMPLKEREHDTSAMLSEPFRTKILINGLIPFYGFYKINYLKEEYVDVRSQMAEMLTQLKREKNKITNHFTSRDVALNSAADTQAVIHLFKFFCSSKLCYKCTVGHRLLNKYRGQ